MLFKLIKNVKARHTDIHQILNLPTLKLNFKFQQNTEPKVVVTRLVRPKSTSSASNSGCQTTEQGRWCRPVRWEPLREVMAKKGVLGFRLSEVLFIKIKKFVNDLHWQWKICVNMTFVLSTTE